MMTRISTLRSRFEKIPITSTGYSYYVLGMIVLVSIFNFLDRQILSMLLEPIKAEFNLSDTKIGFLTGLSFSLFYAIFSIPLARIADNHSRSRLIACVVALWSLMTAMCGLAIGFYTLLIARILVSIGEAGSSPASHSLIADYFGPGKRATAMGIYSSGIYFGIMLGFLLGGFINEYLGWRMAFIVVGLPGILVALLFILTVKEPERGQSEGVLDQTRAPGFREVCIYMWRKQSFRYLPFVMGFSACVAYTNLIWAPSFFIRTHSMGSSEVGAWLALTAGLSGMAGAYLGGHLSDRVVASKNDPRWYMWIPAIATFLSLPFFAVAYLWPNPVTALLLLAIPLLLGNMWIGPTFAIVQGIAAIRMRSTSIAVLALINNIIGLGFGPQLVGIFSDMLAPSLGVESLRYSLIGIVLVAGIVSVILMLLVSGTVRKDLQQ